MLWLDIETRSQTDLVKSGLMNYATCPSTQLICISYAFGEGDVVTWFAEDKAPFPPEVIDHFNSGGVCVAHNAQFERYLFEFVIANDYRFKPPSLTQWQCSSARAMAHGLPGALSNIGKALALPLQKQSEGARLIRDYCAPNFLIEWKEGDRQLMQDYCEMDVKSMRQFCGCLRQLEPAEWEQYHVTERMNDRGVPIHVEFAQAALEYSAQVKGDVDGQIRAHTNGQVKSARARKARDEWLLPLLTPSEIKLITVKKEGKDKISMDKEHQNYLLTSINLNTKARKLVELIQDAGGAAVAKYKAMINYHNGGRVYGAMVWNGAGGTGRYSSRALQLQNFRNNVFDDPEPYIKKVLNHEPLETPAASLARLCRSAITCPSGLTYSDYSQIEARVLPWLAGEGDAEAESVLDIFRNGRDIYSENAVRMFKLDSIEQVTKELRSSAKVAVLALGFGGGYNALINMSKAYGMALTEEEARTLVELWRASNPWASHLWYGLQNAAHKAIKTPNTQFTHGRISYYYDGADWLWAMLPSGRCIAYCQPRFEMVDYPWGDSGVELTALWGSGKPKAGEKWPRRTLSITALSNNVTQATAADVMRETIVRVDKAGLHSLFSVHDEIIVEGNCFDELHEIMETPPNWADRLPIAADTQYAKRYGK